MSATLTNFSSLGQHSSVADWVRNIKMIVMSGKADPIATSYPGMSTSDQEFR
jgi:hypothetical protein